MPVPVDNMVSNSARERDRGVLGVVFVVLARDSELFEQHADQRLIAGSVALLPPTTTLLQRQAHQRPT